MATIISKENVLKWVAERASREFMYNSPPKVKMLSNGSVKIVSNKLISAVHLGILGTRVEIQYREGDVTETGHVMSVNGAVYKVSDLKEI